MLPFSATFTGHLAHAEAIYDGSSRNLVGVTTFTGADGNETPQHAVLLGMSGAGKSVTVCDLLSQTEAYFDYTVIIEEGLSYAVYTRTVASDARPIIIHPDGDLTINYLDTHGLPLTAEHLSSATALVAKLVGVSADEDKQLAREAQIAKYIALLYDDVFAEWSKRNERRLMDLARYACALSRFRRARPGMTILDAFVDFRDAERATPAEIDARLAEVGEEDALRFLKEPTTHREVRNLAFAHLSPAEYPTHRMLQELLQLESTDATDRRPRHPIVTLVRRRKLWLPLGRRNQYIAYGQGRSFRAWLHPGSGQAIALSRRLPHHQSRTPAYRHDAQALAKADRLRRSRPPFGHCRRRANRKGELRPNAKVQLLEHFHRSAVCPFQGKSDSLRGFRQFTPVLPDAPK